MMQRLKCFFGFHKWDFNMMTLAANHNGECNEILFAFKECKCCADSKITFVYKCK